MSKGISAYCINLKHRIDRKISMQGQFELIKDSFDRIDFIEAINGDDIKERNENFHDNRLIGCVMSHIKALKTARENKDEMALICEDDIVFCSNFDERLKAALKEVPRGFDMLYLGYFDNRNIIDRVPVKISDNIVSLNGQTGAFAYIVHNGFYDYLIQELEAMLANVDIVYSVLHQFNYCYSVYPFMVYVREDYSDLSRRRVNYDDRIKIHFKD